MVKLSGASRELLRTRPRALPPPTCPTVSGLAATELLARTERQSIPATNMQRCPLAALLRSAQLHRRTLGSLAECHMREFAHQ
jgi:hypothetical protein